MKNLLVAQSGGPTAAINSTLAGVIEKATENNKVDKVYGSLNGIDGVIEETFIDLTQLGESKEKLYLLERTPAAFLGSCRHKLKDYTAEEKLYIDIIEILKKYNIGYFIYIGGNDSMDTVYKLSTYCRINNISDIKFMGAPKTIDNDLAQTDHCPGFGSAAKYIATTVSEIICDSRVYNCPSVTIIEIMGRNTGWLTAASSLARLNNNLGPQLIYLCEKSFDTEKFTSDVKKALEKNITVVIAVSEGLKDANGNYLGESFQSGKKDAFGHKYLAGVGKYLEQIATNNIGCKVRSVELNVMQRCASHIASSIDLQESKNLGRLAVHAALEGKSGEMTSIKRKSNIPYRVEYRTVKIEKVANIEKTVPLEWITPDGNDIVNEMVEYLQPLIQGEVSIPYKKGIPETLFIKKGMIEKA